ncbi:hypothetical protein WJX82_009716 [Trebouxia sp. C0006]
MGCTTSAPIDEEAYVRKQTANSKQSPGKHQSHDRADDAIKAHPPVTASSPDDKSKERGKAGEGLTVVSHASSAGGRLHATPTRKQLGDGETKQRRVAYGSDVIKDELRKGTGGPQGAGPEQVGDSSEDEDEEAAPAGRRESITRQGSMIAEPKSEKTLARIAAALETSFVFKGIEQSVLQQVISRMFKVTFNSGETVLEQDSLPTDDDCLYMLDTGEVDIVIAGSGEAANTNQEERKVEGGKIKIHMKSGWVFGDTALLFQSPRSASIVASTAIELWAMDRRTFHKFVMRHAPGARALKFVRRLPLFKGLGDNNLVSVASRMREKVYQNGEALIKYGERGDKLYLIRYGKVRILRPDDSAPGGRVEVAKLGRGNLVGERTVVTGKLRSADCVAEGRVQVVVINKKDFMDLDNPLLAWMLDSDAVTTVLRFSKAFQGLPQDRIEEAFDRFAREEFHQGHQIVKEGEPISKMYIIKMGELQCTRNGQPVTAIQEAGGFSYFGEQAVLANEPSPVTITVQSESCLLLGASRRALVQLMGQGPAVMGISADDAALASSALKATAVLQDLNDTEIKSLVGSFELREYNEGMVIAWAGEVDDCMYVVKSGQCLLTTAAQRQVPHDQTLQGSVKVARVQTLPGDKLEAGSRHGEQALLVAQARTTTLVASRDGTQVMALPKEVAEAVLGTALQPLLQQRMAGRNNAKKGQVAKPQIEYQDLEMHRIVGTGQFGMVRVVRHIPTNQAYALKVMHKAPILESKQIEHVLNERRILEEASSHPFCVGLVRAYQDKPCLYLLQEWVGGGELFHHLDLAGAFDEATAMFYAANVLLALEHLHSRGLVYRDLKPENLLLDAQGYCKVADFGFAKKIGADKTYTICGTPDYQAPEVIMRRGTTKAADYWALGVLIFEMLVGDPPFKSLSGDPWDTFRRTLSGRFYVPNFISESASSLICQLLQVSPERRLGSGPTGATEIKQHKWFSRLDWQAMVNKTLPAPINPKLKNPLDTSNFDSFDAPEPPAVPAGKVDKNAHMWDLWDWIDEQSK